MRRRAAFLVSALAVWLAGAALGTAPAGPQALAYPILEVGKAHPAESLPTLTSSKPIFILVVGSGARPGDNVDRSLSDAIHVLGINPAKHQSTILDIPRDSWVSIPGHGQNKINAAMSLGGMPLLIKTVESITGIHINYYTLTTFEGFQAMIDDIGGLYVDVPTAMHDQYSKADFNPGYQRLNGHDALAFARDRHNFTSGDFRRTWNQGYEMISALTQFRKTFVKDPTVMFQWVGAGMRNIETDLSLEQLLNLAFTAYQINPKHVNNIALQGSTGTQQGQSVVFISSSNKKIYKDMKPDAIVKKNVKPPAA